MQQAPHQRVDQQDAEPGDPNEKSAKDQGQLSSRQPIEPSADPIELCFLAVLLPTPGGTEPRATRPAQDPYPEPHEIVGSSVTSDLGDQVMEAAVATVGDAFQPAQSLAFVGVLVAEDRLVKAPAS